MKLINESDIYALFDQSGRANLHVADIDQLPRVNTTPTLHASWLVEREKDTFGYLIHLKCSCCSKRNTSGRTPYCPHCGAKMDLEGLNMCKCDWCEYAHRNNRNGKLECPWGICQLTHEKILQILDKLRRIK